MELERTRGDTYADQFTIGNSTTGSPVNLAGCTVTLTVNTVRNPIDISTQVYQLVGVSDDPASGIVNFAPTAEQANLNGLHYFDIQLTDSNGVIRTLVKGTYSYTQDITK